MKDRISQHKTINMLISSIFIIAVVAVSIHFFAGEIPYI